MAKRDNITADLIRKLLDYDPDTGVLTWRPRTPDMFDPGIQTAAHKCARWNTKFAGKRAGRVDAFGYRDICLLNTRFKEHRLVWLIVTGKWPPHQIDHVNGVKDDNRLRNLRPATQAENLQNLANIKGYYWYKPLSKWKAQIKINGRQTHLGYFESEERAQRAYDEAKAKHHAFNPRRRA